jgi:hypothetical protein
MRGTINDPAAASRARLFETPDMTVEEGHPTNSCCLSVWFSRLQRDTLTSHDHSSSQKDQIRKAINLAARQKLNAAAVGVRGQDRSCVWGRPLAAPILCGKPTWTARFHSRNAVKSKCTIVPGQHMTISRDNPNYHFKRIEA